MSEREYQSLLLRDWLTEEHPGLAGRLDFDPGTDDVDEARRERERSVSGFILDSSRERIEESGGMETDVNCPAILILLGLIPEVREDGRFEIAAQDIVNLKRLDCEVPWDNPLDVVTTLVQPATVEVDNSGLYQGNEDLVREFLQHLSLELAIADTRAHLTEEVGDIAMCRDDPGLLESLWQVAILMESMREGFEGEVAAAPHPEITKILPSVADRWFGDRDRGTDIYPTFTRRMQLCLWRCDLMSRSSFADMVAFARSFGSALAVLNRESFRDDFRPEHSTHESLGQKFRAEFMYSCAAYMMEFVGRWSPLFKSRTQLRAAKIMGRAWSFARDLNVINDEVAEEPEA